MKTTITKSFDAVKYQREEREKLSQKLIKMTKEEILDYFAKTKHQSTVKPGA
jgi:hypothetical protein